MDITNPYNVTYPLSQEIYEDENTLYHGTRSNLCVDIDARGWELNQLPYRIQDVRYVVETIETFRHYQIPGYVALRGCTLGQNNHYINPKGAYFTNFYWGALSYASNYAGETIDSLISAIQELGRFVNTPESMELHLQRLRTELAELHPDHPNRPQIEHAMTSLTNRQLIDDLTRKLPTLEAHYRALIIESYPVVCAIRADLAWFRPNRPPTDMMSRVSIPRRSIIERINYPESVANIDISRGREPRAWNMEPFLNDLRQFRNNNTYQGFIAFYESLNQRFRDILNREE